MHLANAHVALAQLAVHELEGARAGAVERLSLEGLPGLLPPAPAIVEAPLAQATRALLDLLALQRVPARGDHADPDDEQRRGHARGNAKQETLALEARPLAREERRGEREPCAEHEHEREHGAVVRPNAVRLAVLRDPGKCEGDREHRGGRRGGGTNAARLSKRSRVKANQSPSTTSAARIPPREYVRTSATSSE